MRPPLSLLLVLLLGALAAEAQFRVRPYLQNPTAESITIVWFSADNTSGTLTLFDSSATTPVAKKVSHPEAAEALAYPAWEVRRFFSGVAPAPPFVHRVQWAGLTPRSTYRYQVRQGSALSEGYFTTAPAPGTGPVRLVFFADSETEPESTGSHVDWPDPTAPGKPRQYLLDQTDGFANNLRVILERDPDLLIVAGDLVESGGEQRDWDEFWKHLTDVDGINLAGRIPLLAAPGNHEYYEGPSMGAYNQPGSERAAGRFRTYFSNTDAAAGDRYFRLDYGPVSLIALDVTNGSPHRSAEDTNFFLLGKSDAGGGDSPGFAPGSAQYVWLETQLADARRQSAFTFVFFHHVPYSVGPHGWPPGDGVGLDTQSGVPVRGLTPLFHQYGVDALIAGHDEIWERSQIDGIEVLTDGTRVPHTLQIYDVGIAGDGLRGPEQGLLNPYQEFLVHADAPEVWAEGTLLSGGKHYGHLEVDVLGTSDGGWQAVLKPVYVFPMMVGGRLQFVERRLYDDLLTLTSNSRVTAVADVKHQATPASALEQPYPNPFNNSVLLRFALATDTTVRLDVYDMVGQRVRRLLHEPRTAGHHAVEWDARDDAGGQLASGVYLFRLQAGAVIDTVEAALIR